MSEYNVADYGAITNTKVYGLDESIKRAKYPMAVNVDDLNTDITRGIIALATSQKGEGHDNWLNGVVVQFDLDKQYSEYTDKRTIEVVKELVAKYNETKDPEDYLRILYSNPCGFKLIAGMTTNYRQLKTIYSQRRNHRLPEWREFCEWIETLPKSRLITGVEESV